MNLNPQRDFQLRRPAGAGVRRRTSGSEYFLACIALSVALLTGCGRNEVKVYSIPKENTGSASAMPAGHPDIGAGMGGGMNMSPGMGMGMPAPSKLSYKKPEGWNESPSGGVRVASFGILKDGKQADVSVVPLSGTAGGDVANVNRWRGQVGLENLEADALKKSAEPVEVAGQAAELYELSGTNPSSGEPTRILGAIQHREGTAWFFKMTGDNQLVAKEKTAFIAFLKSVSFEAPDAALPASHPPMGNEALPAGHPELSAAAPAAAPSSEGKPSWQVPPGWQEIAGGQFLVAKFTISGEGNSQAAVNVSMSAGAGGGVASNVNRWRTQLGLQPLSDAELEKSLTSVDVNGGKATFVDFSGTDGRSGQAARVIGAIVPQPGQTWFYKLMGDSKLVEAQKDAFTKFVQSVKY